MTPTSQPNKPQPKGPVLVLLLTALVGIGPISTDMYLPALPDMATDFSVSAAAAQATLSIFLLGFAVSQLVIGPLSDRFGRRPVLLIGLLIYVASSVMAAFATSIDMLIWVRFAQAAGACAGGVLGRAVVRDLFDRAEGARMLATLGLIMATAPMVAPIIGGFVVVWSGWPMVFWIMAAAGGLVWLATLLLLPETNASKNPRALKLAPMFATYGRLLGTRAYMGYLLTNGFIFAGMFAFIASASFILIGAYGIAPDRFGLYFAIAVSGYMVGNMATRTLVRTWGPRRLIGIGIGLSLTGALIAAIMAATGTDGPVRIVLAMAVYLAGMGLVLPNCMAGALQPYPEHAGAASALLGFAQMLFAALAGFATGILHDGTALPTTLIMVGLTGAASIIFVSAVRDDETSATSP